MEKGRKSKSGLTDSDIKKFKAALMAKRDETLRNVISMEDETLRKSSTELSKLPIHMADVETDNFGMECTLGLVYGEKKLLNEIDAALQRIEDGTYGICEGNGKPIPKKRLEALPWTRYCVEYASSLEKGIIKEAAEEEDFPPDDSYTSDDETS
jgi:RNA polymerase-binding protein DksA